MSQLLMTDTASASRPGSRTTTLLRGRAEAVKVRPNNNLERCCNQPDFECQAAQNAARGVALAVDRECQLGSCEIGGPSISVCLFGTCGRAGARIASPFHDTSHVTIDSYKIDVGKPAMVHYLRSALGSHLIAANAT